MLDMHGIANYFEFVVTSVSEGWRKPHQEIYEKALKLAGIAPERVVFVGDDYINDYVTPSRLGMTPIYLDRYDRHPELQRRIKNFSGLHEILKDSQINI